MTADLSKLSDEEFASVYREVMGSDPFTGQVTEAAQAPAAGNIDLSNLSDKEFNALYEEVMGERSPLKAESNLAAVTAGAFGSGILGSVGDLVSLMNAGQDFIFDQTLGRVIAGDPEKSAEMREDIRKNGSTFAKTLLFLQGGFRDVVPTTEQIKEGLDDFTRGATEADTRGGRVLEKAAEFAGGFLGFGGLARAGKGGLNLGQAALEIASGAAGGAAQQQLQEEGFGPTGQFLGSLVSSLAPAGAAKLSKIGLGAGEIALGRGKGVTKFVKPKQIQQDTIKLAKELNVQVPASSLIDNDVIKAVETKLAQSGLSGKALEEAREAFQAGMIRNINDTVESVAKVAPESAFEAGANLQTNIVEARDILKASSDELYQTARSAEDASVKLAPSKTGKDVRKTLKELQKTKIPNADEQSTINILSRLESELFDEAGNLKNLSVSELQSTHQSLNGLINFEVQGTPKKLLLGVKDAIEKDLLAHSSKAPKSIGAWKAAREEFQQLAKKFRNKQINKAIFEQDPEKLAKLGGSVGELKQLEFALSELGDQGKAALQEFKRYKLEQLFTNQIVDPVTGQFKIGKSASILSNPKNAALLRELVGAEQFKKLRKMATLSKQVSQASNKFLNASQSAVASFDAIAGISIVKDLFGGLISLNPVQMAMGGFKGLSPRVMSRALADPKIVTELEKLANAAARGNTVKFADQSRLVQTLVLDLARSLDED